MDSVLLLVMFPTLCVMLLAGIPVAFALFGTAFLMGGIGMVFGVFSGTFFAFLPDRVYGIMTNDLLVSVPLFIFMGIMLERSGLAEDLLRTIGSLFGQMSAGMAIGVSVVGTLLAASTGVVGATVVAMGLLALPAMLKQGYSAPFACGSICAAGTLGQIIPPSILLILLSDQISSAYRVGQMSVGNMMPESVSVLDLFAGAFVPGLVLVGFYIIFQIGYGLVFPHRAPPIDELLEEGSRLRRVMTSLVPPLLLIVVVLGSILTGAATPTEAAAMGGIGAVLLAAAKGRFKVEVLSDVVRRTTRLTAMIFTILIGATLFSLVFRGLGGDEVVHEVLTNLPGGTTGALVLVMIIIFLLGFFLDFIEIVFIVIPVIGPPLFALDINPLWFSILLAVTLQTSFLTPPVGFALFYIQGVTPPEVGMRDVYIGVIPFIIIQLMVLGMVAMVPELATWLPEALNGAPMFQ